MIVEAALANGRAMLSDIESKAVLRAFRIPSNTTLEADDPAKALIAAETVGFPIVIGENVVGVDQAAELKNGKIKKAPELERRIETYLRYYDGYGAILVQLNVEDTRNGVAEYVIEKYGDKVIIELKWGQGAKNIGGEIQVNSLEYAQFLKDRGYVVDPDPISTQ